MHTHAGMTGSTVHVTMVKLLVYLVGRQGWSLARTSLHALYPVAPLLSDARLIPKQLVGGRPDSSEQLDLRHS